MEALLAAAIEEDAAMAMHMMGTSTSQAAASASSPWEASSSSRLPSFARHDDPPRDGYRNNHAPRDPIVDDGYHRNSPGEEPFVDGRGGDGQGFPPPPADPSAFPPSAGGTLTWQAMFRQLKDFHDLGHTKYPPRMARWMNAQRRQYKMYGVGIKKPMGIITGRIRQLNSIGFEWNAQVVTPDADANGSTNGGFVMQQQQYYTKSPVHPRVMLPPGYNPGNNGTTAASDNNINQVGPPGSKNKKKSLPQLFNGQGRHHKMLNNSSRGPSKRWTPDEDEMIEVLQGKLGNKWSTIAKRLGTGRTDGDVKNRFHSRRRSRERMDANPYYTGNGDDGDSDRDMDDDGIPKTVSAERQKYVQNMVKAALEKERRESRSKGRNRRPWRRVQESYDSSDVESEGYEDDEEIAASTRQQRLDSRHHGNSFSKSTGHQCLEATTPSVRKKQQLFVELLHQMVNECSVTYPHIVEWTPDGKAFRFKDVDQMPELIGMYFRHNKFKSLQRMLHMYNFKKFATDDAKAGMYEGCFYHDHFHRWSTRESILAGVTKDGVVGDVTTIMAESPDAETAASSQVLSAADRRRQRASSRSGSISRKSASAPKSTPASKTKKKAKHSTPGKAGGLPNHALFASKPKGGGPQKQQAKQHEADEPPAVGASHPSLLFNLVKKEKPSPESASKQKEPVSPVETAKENGLAQSRNSDEVMQQIQSPKDDNGDEDNSKTATTAQSAEATTKSLEPSKPTPSQQTQQLMTHDMLLTLEQESAYKKLMMSQFQLLGRKRNNGKADDCNLLRNTARNVFNTLKSLMVNTSLSGMNGRFMKKIKGGDSVSGDGDGSSWYEVVDDSWALQKISNDLRTRMDTASSWLNDNGIDVHNASIGQSSAVASKEENEPQQQLPKGVNASSAEDDPMPNQKDLVISLTTPKYREVMFIHFTKLGNKAEEDDYKMLKVLGKAIFDGFKNDMGKGGRFFRKSRGASEGEAPYELLDDDTALTRMTQDLRRRMDSANYWLNMDTAETKEEEEQSVSDAKHVPRQTENEQPVAESKPEASPPKTPSSVDTAVASKRTANEMSESPEASRNSPNWKLGSYGNMPGVQYFKSDIGKLWVEQIVPRKTVKVGGPESDRYFLAPDGNRFRSMLEVQRFLEKTDQIYGIADSEENEEGDEVEEGVGNDASDTLHESGEEDDDGDESKFAIGAAPINNNPCMCRKSKCLKLYCECFSKEKFCSGCHCMDCHNNPNFAAERDKVIADIKKKNPEAFIPRVKDTIECRCKKSACLKKYCDCYLNEKYCGDSCQCRGCENRNTEKSQKPLQRREYHENEEPEEASSSNESGEEFQEEEKWVDNKEQTNFAMDEDGKPKNKNGSPKKRSFPQSLHDMVSHIDARDPSVMSWMPGGEAFSIHDRSKEKLGPYLQQYFLHNNYNSLVRQLNSYGFTRHMTGWHTTGSLDGAFHRSGFHKDIKLCQDFSSFTSQRNGENTGKKRAAESKKEEGQPRKITKVAPAKKTSGLEAKQADTKEEPVTMTCPMCFKDFTFPYPRTAGASFSRHVKACKREEGQEKDAMDIAKSEEPDKIICQVAPKRSRKSSSSQKKDIAVDSPAEKKKSLATSDPQSPVTFHCAKCGRDFTFASKKTAMASFKNHERKCDPEKAKAILAAKVKALESRKAKALEKKEAKAKRRGSKGSSLAPKEVPSILPETVPSYTAASLEDKGVLKEKAAAAADSSSKKEKLNPKPIGIKEEPTPKHASVAKKPPDAPVTKKAPTTPEPTPSAQPASGFSGKPHDDDIVLSLKCPRYKQFMFAQFQTLGKRAGGGENNRLHEMKTELFLSFKQKMGDDGRFLKSDRHMNETWTVSDDDALTKIMMDLKRRNESSKHWFQE